MDERIKAWYRGDGSEYLSRIRAGDLTVAEFDALSVEDRARVRNARMSSGGHLYDVATPAELDEQALAEAPPPPADAAVAFTPGADLPEGTEFVPADDLGKPKPKSKARDQ